MSTSWSTDIASARSSRTAPTFTPEPSSTQPVSRWCRAWSKGTAINWRRRARCSAEWISPTGSRRSAVPEACLTKPSRIESRLNRDGGPGRACSWPVTCSTAGGRTIPSRQPRRTPPWSTWSSSGRNGSITTCWRRTWGFRMICRNGRSKARIASAFRPRRTRSIRRRCPEPTA